LTLSSKQEDPGQALGGCMTSVAAGSGRLASHSFFSAWLFTTMAQYPWLVELGWAPFPKQQQQAALCSQAVRSGRKACWSCWKQIDGKVSGLKKKLNQ